MTDRPGISGQETVDATPNTVKNLRHLAVISSEFRHESFRVIWHLGPNIDGFALGIAGTAFGGCQIACQKRLFILKSDPPLFTFLT